MMKIKCKKDRGILSVKVKYHEFTKEEQEAAVEEEKKRLKAEGIIGSTMDAVGSGVGFVGSGVGAVESGLGKSGKFMGQTITGSLEPVVLKSILLKKLTVQNHGKWELLFAS